MLGNIDIPTNSVLIYNISGTWTPRKRTQLSQNVPALGQNFISTIEFIVVVEIYTITHGGLLRR
jgi:hypothetical protein